MIRFNGYKEVNNEMQLECAMWGNTGEFSNLSGLDRRTIFDTLNANQHWLDIIVKQPDITKVTFSWWFAHRPRTAATIRVVNDIDAMGVFIPDIAVPNRRVDIDVDNMTVIQMSGDQTYAMPMTKDMLQQYEPYLRVAAAAHGVLPRVNFIVRHNVQKVGAFQVDFIVIEAVCPLQTTREGYDWPATFKESLGSLVGETVFIPEGSFPKGSPPEPKIQGIPISNASGIPSSMFAPGWESVSVEPYFSGTVGRTSGIPSLGSPDVPVDITITRRRWSTTQRAREQLIRDLNSIVSNVPARSHLYLEEAFLADELITLLQTYEVRNSEEWVRNEIHDAYRILQYDRRNRVTTARPARNGLLENMSRSEAQAAFALRQEQAMSSNLEVVGDVHVSATVVQVSGNAEALIRLPDGLEIANAVRSGGSQIGRTTEAARAAEYERIRNQQLGYADGGIARGPNPAPVTFTAEPGYYHWFWPLQAAVRMALTIIRWFRRRRQPASLQLPPTYVPLEVILRSYFGDTIIALQTSTACTVNGQVRCEAECQIIYRANHRMHQPGERIMDLQRERVVARIVSIHFEEQRGFGAPQMLRIRLDVAPFAILRDFDGDLP